MSNLITEPERKTDFLIKLFYGLLKGEYSKQLVAENQELIESFKPSDIVLLINKLVLTEVPMEDLKKGVNRIFSLLHKTISEHPYSPPSKESYLGCLLENNRILDEKLKQIKPLLRQFNDTPLSVEIKAKLVDAFFDLDKFRSYYRIKEEILFPEIEKYISEHGCLSVMGSFHDEVKEKMKLTFQELNTEYINLEEFNRLTGELFFTMYALKFREERVLYALVQDVVSDSVLNSLYEGSLEIGFPYFNPEGFGNKKIET